MIARPSHRRNEGSASIDLPDQLAQGDAAKALLDRDFRALRDREHDPLHITAHAATFKRFAFVRRDHRPWAYRLIDIKERDARRALAQSRAAVSPRAGRDQSRAPQRLKQPPDHDRIGVDAGGESLGVELPARKSERRHDVDGKSKLLVDHSV